MFSMRTVYYFDLRRNGYWFKNTKQTRNDQQTKLHEKNNVSRVVTIMDAKKYNQWFMSTYSDHQEVQERVKTWLEGYKS